MNIPPPSRRRQRGCPGTAARQPALTLTVPEEVIEAIAQRAAHLAADILSHPRDEPADGYLPPAGAAAYLGVSRQRIHQLTSSRALCPDGRDGRTPLYTRASLDRYVQECASGRRGR